MNNIKKRLAITTILSIVCVITAITYAVATRGGSLQNPVIQSAITSSESNNISDPIEVLTQNPNFHRQGLELKAAKGEFKIARKKAIELACIQKSEAFKTTKKVTAIKTNLTELLNESPTAMHDRPVWIVTFHETEMQRHSPNPDGDNTVIADCNVVIDGVTGEWLTTFSYNHS